MLGTYDTGNLSADIDRLLENISTTKQSKKKLQITRDVTLFFENFKSAVISRSNESQVELLEQCANNALKAMEALIFFLIQKEFRRIGIFEADYAGIVVCFNDSLKFLQQGNLKVASEGLEYLSTVLSALKEYETKMNFARPQTLLVDFSGKKTQHALRVIKKERECLCKLKTKITDANQKIEHSELNTPRSGFPWLVAWLTGWVIKCTTTYNNTQKITGYLQTKIGSVLERSKSPKEQALSEQVQSTIEPDKDPCNEKALGACAEEPPPIISSNSGKLPFVR